MAEQTVEMKENNQNPLTRYRRHIFLFLAVLGPSVITTMAGNDGAGVITYSYAGAHLGYGALFLLPILTILYGISQEMGSRAAIVTGKGLGDIIRERFGIKVAFFAFAALLVANFGTLLTNFAALKTAGAMLNIPPTAFLVVTILFCFSLVTFTRYEKSQKIFLTGIVFYLAYVFSAYKIHPDWTVAVQSLFIPPSNIFSPNYLIIAVAVLGTTITPWGQFFIQSYMKDKNVPVSRLSYAKLESYLGAFISNFFTFFIIAATAATLYAFGMPLESGEQAAIAIRPFAGSLASFLFALGLINAALIGIVIVSLTSAYAFTEFFGFTGSLDEPFKRGPIFYSLFLINLIGAAFCVLTPFFPLFKIVLYTQSLNGILLPLFFYFLIKILNDKELMGKYVNSRGQNIFAVASTVVIAVCGVAAVAMSVLS
ncbi:MAG: divalent metal cation transporter [Candidatus Doudnabacteria bacterium]|nr:divalent metal cation transporter [Candidatus Doudnabacteria bacterium]